jgi:hypothetical protein
MIEVRMDVVDAPGQEPLQAAIPQTQVSLGKFGDKLKRHGRLVAGMERVDRE